MQDNYWQTDITHDNHNRGEGITLLVPFRARPGIRTEVWSWLKRYWGHELPYAEMLIGENFDTPFCKTAAVDDAFRRSHGDVVVILDADCYLSGDVVLECAHRIRQARARNDKLWFVPYRHFYRLTEAASRRVLASPPANPLQFSTPPPEQDTEPVQGASFGHWFGALVQVMPREAFIAAGGMDERFAGWGGEDVSFMMAVDTLYGKHMTTRNQVLHLWHPHAGVEWDERTWEGQDEPGNNNPLTERYQQCRGHEARMRMLVSEPRHKGL